MIPICLILFILFIAVITFAIKRADSAQAKVTEEFWEKERKANSTLRGDTTDLCYITIPEKVFPLNNDKINDLKLKYGILNFKKLSEYDDNFTKFVSMLESLQADATSAGNYSHLLMYLLRYSSYSLEARLLVRLSHDMTSAIPYSAISSFSCLT